MASLPRDGLGFLLPASSGVVTQSASSPSGSGGPGAAKWASLNVPTVLTDASPPPTQDLLRAVKDLIRHGGIPSALRPTMWFWLSGGFAMRASMPAGYYQRLAGSTDYVDDTSSMSIEKGTSALFSCFRHHMLLQSPRVSAWDRMQHGTCPTLQLLTELIAFIHPFVHGTECCMALRHMPKTLPLHSLVTLLSAAFSPSLCFRELRLSCASCTAFLPPCLSGL